MPREFCITHHYACGCREEEFQTSQEENKTLRAENAALKSEIADLKRTIQILTVELKRKWIN